MTRIASDMVATMNDQTGCCCAEASKGIPGYMRHARDPYQPLAPIAPPLNARRYNFIRWIAPMLILCGIGVLIGVVRW